MNITIGFDDNGKFGVITEENREKKLRIDKGRSLIDFPNEYVIIDIETTGLDSYYDDIIEISAIKYKENVSIAEYSTLVRPNQYVIIDEDDQDDDYCVIDGQKIQYIDSYISNLTGITNKMLTDAPKLKDILQHFDDFIEDSILLGHNVNFDINFLYDSYIEVLDKPLKNDFIDTLRLARKLLPDLKHHKLDDLIKHFNLENREKHRALRDCSLTGEIYSRIIKLILNKYQSLEEFKKLYIESRKRVILRASDIISTVDEFDEENPLYEKECVFTGVLEKMQRREAMQIVVNLGGTCGDTVTSRTNYLILGNNDYCKTIKDGKSSKQKKAEKLKIEGQDIEIISERVFYDIVES